MPELTDNPCDIRAGVRLVIYNVVSVVTEAGASGETFLKTEQLDTRTVIVNMRR